MHIYIHKHKHTYLCAYIHTCTLKYTNTSKEVHTFIVFIDFIPIHTGRKDASDAVILKDLLCWALDNPPPSHVLLISGDHYYATTLSDLKSRGYNTLLIRPKLVATSLLESVNHSLKWSDVAMGTGIVA